MDIRQPEMASLELVRQPFVIAAEAVKNGGLQIGDMDRVGNYIVAIIIGLADTDAGLYTAAGGPHRKTTRMVIAPVIGLRELALAVDGAAEFPAPDDQRVIE